jgi:hypothetical protein
MRAVSRVTGARVNQAGSFIYLLDGCVSAILTALPLATHLADIVYNVPRMPLYRIYRMKDSPRQQFRWAPHLSGCASLKPRDYEPGGQVDARNEYDAWQMQRESEEPLMVGDLLETGEGQLRVCKYVGFEPAQWVVPELKQPAEPPPVLEGVESTVS